MVEDTGTSFGRKICSRISLFNRSLSQTSIIFNEKLRLIQKKTTKFKKVESKEIKFNE